MPDERKPEDKDARRPYSGPRRTHGSSGADKAAAVTGKKYFRRKKVCKFCVDKIDNINYKEVGLLRGFVAERGRIIPRRISGVCTPHQRLVSDAIKKARNIALLPFAAEL